MKLWLKDLFDTHFYRIILRNINSQLSPVIPRKSTYLSYFFNKQVDFSPNGKGVLFFAPKTGMRLSCTINYNRIPENCSHTLERKPCTCNQHKRLRKFRLFW